MLIHRWQCKRSCDLSADVSVKLLSASRFAVVNVQRFSAVLRLDYRQLLANSSIYYAALSSWSKLREYSHAYNYHAGKVDELCHSWYSIAQHRTHCMYTAAYRRNLCSSFYATQSGCNELLLCTSVTGWQAAVLDLRKSELLRGCSSCHAYN
jgi:hypothetical protein